MDQKTFDIIHKIAEEHSNKEFGYLNKDDLKSEIWVICLDKIKDFDYTKGELEHFLRVTVRNRLINRFKDVTKNVRSPCPRCPFYDPNAVGACLKFGESKYRCNKWRNFELSTNSRNSLLNASEPQVERHAHENILSYVSAQEIKTILVDKVEKKFQRDLKLLISNGKLSKLRLKKLKKEIFRVLETLPHKFKDKNKELVQLTIGNKNKDKE